MSHQNVDWLQLLKNKPTEGMPKFPLEINNMYVAPYDTEDGVKFTYAVLQKEWDLYWGLLYFIADKPLKSGKSINITKEHIIKAHTIMDSIPRTYSKEDILSEMKDNLALDAVIGASNQLSDAGIKCSQKDLLDLLQKAGLINLSNNQKSLLGSSTSPSSSSSKSTKSPTSSSTSSSSTPKKRKSAPKRKIDATMNVDDDQNPPNKSDVNNNNNAANNKKDSNKDDTHASVDDVEMTDAKSDSKKTSSAKDVSSTPSSKPKAPSKTPSADTTLPSTPSTVTPSSSQQMPPPLTNKHSPMVPEKPANVYPTPLHQPLASPSSSSTTTTTNNSQKTPHGSDAALTTTTDLGQRTIVVEPPKNKESAQVAPTIGNPSDTTARTGTPTSANTNSSKLRDTPSSGIFKSTPRPKVVSLNQSPSSSSTTTTTTSTGNTNSGKSGLHLP